MATYSTTLAWRIPWTEEHGGLWSIGSQRVGHDWSNLACRPIIFCTLIISFNTWLWTKWMNQDCKIYTRLIWGSLLPQSTWWITWTFQILCVPSCSVVSDSCNPRDYSLPGSSVYGFLQARILKWVAMPSSKGSSQPRDQTHPSYLSLTLAGRFFITRAT